MPPGSSQYTLVGFSPELDWRPLSFVKPIPSNRICSACGLVRKRTAWLPCMHVLCDSCYEQSGQEGLHVCPLDGNECPDEDDVDWKEIPAEQLLKREVRCWNEERGCSSVVAASELFRHFQRECRHHSVSCPKCSAGVLCSDVCSHLRSSCDTKGTPLGTGAEVPSDCKDATAFLATFRAELEKQAAESRRLYERLVADIAMHGDALNGVSHAINTLKETLNQELAAETLQKHDILTKGMHDITASTEEVKSCVTTLSDAIINLPGIINTLERTIRKDLDKETKDTRDHLSQIANAIKAEGKENTQMTVEKIAQFIGRTQVALTMFTVKGVEELREKALKQGWSTYVSEKVYLRGYCILPGVYLVKKGESVKLCARIVLCKGDMDDFLQWPFQHKVGLSVVRRKDGSKREYVEVPDHSHEFFQKPAEAENKALAFSRNPLDLNDIITGGFVENDNLVVRLELHP